MSEREPMKDGDYERLLEFRRELRGFLSWSEGQAKAEGVTPGQHQLLLAIRGHGGAEAPTVGEAAEYLSLQHHSAVGLVDRAVDSGLVERLRDPDDLRVVRLQLTPKGQRLIERLTRIHLEELGRIRSFVLPDAPGGRRASDQRQAKTGSST